MKNNTYTEPKEWVDNEAVKKNKFSNYVIYSS